jgi:hypothetical protein
VGRRAQSYPVRLWLPAQDIKPKTVGEDDGDDDESED